MDPMGIFFKRNTLIFKVQVRLFHYMLQVVYRVTLIETNIAPENRPPS